VGDELNMVGAIIATGGLVNKGMEDGRKFLFENKSNS
jgi:hypothetical protein